MAEPKLKSGRIGGPYWCDESGMSKDAKEGAYQCCNFVAWIDEEHVYHDAGRTTTVLTVRGCMLDGEGEEVNLPPVQIDATEMKSMTWVSQRWGMRPIIYPQASAERDIATMMQMISQADRKDIYTATGWNKIHGKPVYLSGNGAIGGGEEAKKVSVQLPHELSRYELPKPKPCRDEVMASLNLVNLGPVHVMWPLLLATYRSAIGGADFAMHLAGRTGTFKSEVSSLFQSHFGARMDARHMPASWNSTANALEALAHKAKDSIMVIDDFVPVGTSTQVRTLQAKADQIIRAQGNQAGRTRLTDTSNVQSTMFPRGILLSTGEDIPEGHSVRARMLISELSPGDIPSDRLSQAQSKRESYAAAMADWISWLSKQGDARVEFKVMSAEIRDMNLDIGHSRTPPIVGDLTATAMLMAHWMREREYFSDESLNRFTEKAAAAIEEAGKRQKTYLQSADPVLAFCGIIRQLLSMQQAHVKTVNGGIPLNAALLGWTGQEQAGEVTAWKANGPRLGWVDTEKGEFLFDPNSLPLIKKHSNGQLAVTPQTFIKRLRDANMIVRYDASRQRNTVRQTLEGHPHNVVVLLLSSVMEGDEGDGPE